jgi:hypothetical protein
MPSDSRPPSPRFFTSWRCRSHDHDIHQPGGELLHDDDHDNVRKYVRHIDDRNREL